MRQGEAAVSLQTELLAGGEFLLSTVDGLCGWDLPVPYMQPVDSPWQIIKHGHCINDHYKMTVWIVVGNGVNFSIAVGLIKLHMPGVK